MTYLNLKEVASLFGVSQKTVYRLLDKGELPGLKIGGQWRFNRQEVEIWLKRERPEVYITEEVYKYSANNRSSLLFSEVLQTGGIFFNIAGTSVKEILENSIKTINIEPQIERKKLIKAVTARERLCTTAIGRGVALPHPRRPYQFNFEYSSISLCFLKNKIDFGAMDNKPVNKLFFVFSKTEKEHLNLLKILVNLLLQPEFIGTLESPKNQLEIFDTIQKLENRFQPTVITN